MQPNVIVTEFFFVEDPIQVIETLKAHLRTIVQGSKCSTFRVVISGETNFREDIATIKPYKGNREGMVKPIHFDLIRDWLIDKPYTILSDNEEADDVISRAMMEGHVGASPDKDLNNTPGTHFNFRKWETYEVTEDEAIRNFYKQMLTGDTADNIPGIKGYGPIKAGRLIDNCSTVKGMEEVVHETYKGVYDDPVAAMTEVGQLLWMRREENEMWEPKYL